MAGNLLDTIIEIENGERVSSHKKTVTNVITTFKAYREEHEPTDAKDRPKDYVAVGKAISRLEEAEDAFELESKDVYATKKAHDASKLVVEWVHTNVKNDPK